MLQTKIVNDEMCAVSYNPTEIMIRKRGKAYYGIEEQLVTLKNGKLYIFVDVANKFGIDVVEVQDERI